MNNPFARSLPLRLLVIVVALTAIALIAIIAGFSRGLGSQWRATIGPHLALYAQYVQDDLGYPPDPATARSLAARLPLDIYVYRDAQFVYSTNGRSLALNDLTFTRRPAHRRHHGAVPFEIAENDNSGNTLLRTRQRDYTVYFELQRRTERGRREGYHLGSTLLILLLLLATGFWLIRRQLAPISVIQRGVARMRDGELDHRIHLSGRDDLATLSHSIDDMARRIEAMLDAKRQLLLALSHELRTPLARARVEIELLPDDANTDRLREDLTEMQALIDVIIESERLQHHGVLNLGELDLAALLADIASAVKDPVELRGVEQPCHLVGDHTRLVILFRNIVNNAVQHGRPTADVPARVTIDIVRDAADVQVDVSDEGAGVDPSQVALLVEPFHRIDDSRTRDTGGVGLGLTLARLITEAHGGSLDIHSNPAQQPGTRVRVRLPLDPRAASASARPGDGPANDRRRHPEPTGSDR